MRRNSYLLSWYSPIIAFSLFLLYNKQGNNIPSLIQEDNYNVFDQSLYQNQFSTDTNFQVHEIVNTQCVTDEQHKEIFARHDRNIKELQEKGLIPTRFLRSNLPPVLFDFPLKLSAGYQCNNYFVISNYVDHDPT